MVLKILKCVTYREPGARATLTTLPPDLLKKIISQLGQSSVSQACPWNPACARHATGGLELPHREKDAQAALYSLCLTSTQMRELATPALYNVVTLLSGLPRRTSSRTAIYLFLRTLVENPRLRPLVRHLSCRCYEQSDRPLGMTDEFLHKHEILDLLAEIKVTRSSDRELLRRADLEAPTEVLRRTSLDQRVLCAILFFTRRLETLSLGTLHIGSNVFWYAICGNNIVGFIGEALEEAVEQQLPVLLPCLRAVKIDDNIHTDDKIQEVKEYRQSSLQEILLSLPAMSKEGIDICLAELV